MHRTLLLAVALVSVAAHGGRAQAVVPLAQVLTFEADHRNGVPTGWGVSPPGSAVVDGAVARTGKWSARVTRDAGSAGAFSGISQSYAVDVAGSNVVLRAYLRTADVTDAAALWVRLDGESPNLAFASTQPRKVNGTTDWHEHTVTVPLRPEGQRLVFGVFVAGTGTVWVDDVELLVDGVPIWERPKVERAPAAGSVDQEFDRGSGVALTALTSLQVDNLTTLGLVWGFLKYHHPAVSRGGRHWDYDLFRIMPDVVAASSRSAANDAMVKWISGLGAVAACTTCAAIDESTLHLPPDLGWLSDTDRLGPELSALLRHVHTNRPADDQRHFVSLSPNVGHPIFKNERTYADLALPDSGFQLLAAYRWWNVIQYWFPYRDVIGDDWVDALRELIPRVGLAATREDFQRELMALVARAHDTHANLWSSIAVRPPVGPCQWPLDVRFVEGRPVVTRESSGFQRGDVLTTIDGTPIEALVKTWSPYYAASNEPTRLRDVARAMGRGPCAEVSVGALRNGSSLTTAVSRVPTTAPAGPPTHDLPGETFRLLSPDVAYLKLSTIKAPEVPGFVAAAAGTKGLVIDIRDYPSAFVVFALGQYLVAESTPFARFTRGDLTTPGAFHWGPSVTLTPTAPRYTGKVVILVDEISQSQAEYTAMAFRVAPGAVVIGSTTAGADGNVSEVPLPGGLRALISGIGVFYPDKRPTQRIGIVPDLEVRPTIAGIRDGRDEVLEAALQEILGPSAALASIQSLIASARK
jgi:hypothetical protein